MPACVVRSSDSIEWDHVSVFWSSLLTSNCKQFLVKHETMGREVAWSLQPLLQGLTEVCVLAAEEPPLVPDRACMV